MQSRPLDVDELELFFKDNHTYLCLVSLTIVKDHEVAKDVVQDFFISFWERRNSIRISTSFKAYAVKAIKNLSIQYLRENKKEESLIKELGYKDSYELKPFEKTGNRKKLQELLTKLPENRRNIFISYVIYGQSYAEIAENNGISVNTVKTQMKRAYRFLRSEAKPDMLYFLMLSSPVHFM
ncbi:RNA polymerase sigma-70 factor (ECF subfamily) [Flavobacteriaceae bacterium MAR_2009_75]|nr:RNA polymerase sigma-70 factor (ECF subfamily) [Flavobacteriaceae bacterium MAR_2009_75]